MSEVSTKLDAIEPSFKPQQQQVVKTVTFHEDLYQVTQTRYPLSRQLMSSVSTKHKQYYSTKRKKRKQKNNKVAICLHQFLLVIANQLLWLTILLVIAILCVATTVVLAYVEGRKLGKTSRNNIAKSIVEPLHLEITKNSDWINYFADSLTVGGVFCNATKKFLTSVNFVKEKTKLLEKDPNFYSNTNTIAISNNTAEKLFSLTTAEKSSINNAFYIWTSYQLDTIDHIRLLSHSAMEMIKVDNRIQNNKTVTSIQTALVNRADAPPYIPYLNGESNENVVFGVLDLKRGSSYNIIPTPLVALLRSQRTILCDLSESEWSTLNTTLIKDRITSRSNGKQVLKAGFMVGSINLNAFFSKTTKVVPSNSFLRVMIINQSGQYYFDSVNSTKAFLHYLPKYQNISSSQSIFTKEDYDNSTLSQVIDGCLSGTYEPIWYKGKTLYYTDFSTNAETFYVVVEEQIQDVIYRGFYTIVVGLFVFFMFVTFTIVLFIFQRDKIENLLISSTNLRKAMEENGKEQMEFRDMYEMAYFSLVPESIIMKNPKGLDNYYEHVKDAVFTNMYCDFKVTQLQQCICQQHSTPEKVKTDRLTSNVYVIKKTPLSAKRFIQYSEKVMSVLKKVCWFHGFNIIDSSSNQLKCYRNNTCQQTPQVQQSKEHFSRDDLSLNDIAADDAETKSGTSLSQSVVISPSKSTQTLSSASSHWIADTPYSCYEHIVSGIYLTLSLFYICQNYSLQFEDDEDERDHCFAVIPFPKISIALHIGDSNFAVIDQGIPCWKTFGKTFNRLQGMLNQEVICKRESQSMDYNNNCLLLSDAVFSKIQIISSIMNDRVNLIQNERKENCKLEQKVLKLINPSFQKLESPRNLELERIVLNNKKDFMFHRLLINQTKKVFDEILQVDSNFFFQTFIPKEVMTDLIPKIERNN
ncbi:hypothetical protein ABK040_000482 [Willaertia magna]